MSSPPSSSPSSSTPLTSRPLLLPKVPLVSLVAAALERARSFSASDRAVVASGVPLALSAASQRSSEGLDPFPLHEDITEDESGRVDGAGESEDEDGSESSTSSSSSSDAEGGAARAARLEEVEDGWPSSAASSHDERDDVSSETGPLTGTDREVAGVVASVRGILDARSLWWGHSHAVVSCDGHMVRIWKALLPVGWEEMVASPSLHPPSSLPNVPRFSLTDILGSGVPSPSSPAQVPWPRWCVILFRSGYFACAILEMRPLDLHELRAIVRATSSSSSSSSSSSPLTSTEPTRWLQHLPRELWEAIAKKRVVVHRSIRKYTVRKKQGGAQSKRDNSGGGRPRSIGAQLRRRHETLLEEQIHATWSEWAGHLHTVERFFVSCSRPNLHFLFTNAPTVDNSALLSSPPGPSSTSSASSSSSSATPSSASTPAVPAPSVPASSPSSSGVVPSGPLYLLGKDDPRIRRLPVLTGRPTYVGVLQAWTQLSLVEYLAEESTVVHAMRAALGAGEASVSSAVRSMLSDATASATAAADADGIMVTLAASLAAPSPLPVALVRELSHGGSTPSPGLTSPPPPAALTSRQRRLLEACEDGDRDRAEEVILEARSEVERQLEDAAEARASAAFRSTPPTSSSSSSSSSSSAEEAEEAEELAALNEALSRLVNAARPLDGTTALHAAARSGAAALVTQLLQHGADPTVRDFRRRTAFQVATHESVRRAMADFRRRHPARWDYAKAGLVAEEAGGSRDAVASGGGSGSSSSSASGAGKSRRKKRSKQGRRAGGGGKAPAHGTVDEEEDEESEGAGDEGAVGGSRSPAKAPAPAASGPSAADAARLVRRRATRESRVAVLATQLRVPSNVVLAAVEGRGVGMEQDGVPAWGSDEAEAAAEARLRTLQVLVEEERAGAADVFAVLGWSEAAAVAAIGDGGWGALHIRPRS